MKQLAVDIRVQTELLFVVTAGCDLQRSLVFMLLYRWITALDLKTMISKINA